MIRSTICHMERDGRWLMLYRNKKKNDPNAGKWVGIGGKLEPGETPEECCIRECFEETGLKVSEPEFRGLVHFRSSAWPAEDMHVYTASQFDGDLSDDCNEGTLKWIPKEEILSLSLWEGDRLFLTPILSGEGFSEMTLVYEGDELVRHYLGPARDDEKTRETWETSETEEKMSEVLAEASAAGQTGGAT